MTKIGIICEYNPLHFGHIWHIEQTRGAYGDDCAVICVMSGNFVQRGDLAVFSKHSRAEAAVRCGADLVIELPLPYVLSSAERFAFAGVYLLDSIGVDVLSFGSESGDISALCRAARAIVSAKSCAELKKWLDSGFSYAGALQKAAQNSLDDGAELFLAPNNLLAIEYIKAIDKLGSNLRPFTALRTGGGHDSDSGCCASYLRKLLYAGEPPWQYMSKEAANVFAHEMAAGRGPVSQPVFETAILSRLRAMTEPDFAALPHLSEGFERRFMRFAASEASVSDILDKTKTKRYPMSRIRRLLFCAVLGVTEENVLSTPPYIRVLAMNNTGMKLLKDARDSCIPIITKPASVRSLSESARKMLDLEARSTDFFVLGYQDKNMRRGGQEWTVSPRIIL